MKWNHSLILWLRSEHWQDQHHILDPSLSRKILHYPHPGPLWEKSDSRLSYLIFISCNEKFSFTFCRRHREEDPTLQESLVFFWVLIFVLSFRFSTCFHLFLGLRRIAPTWSYHSYIIFDLLSSFISFTLLSFSRISSYYIIAIMELVK